MNLGNLWITFDRPWYLLLLGLIPVVWYLGRDSLAGLGRFRRWFALVLRTAVIALLALAAAEVQWVRTSKRLTVIYLLDQSASIPLDRRKGMIEYVNAAVRRHRNGDDRAGVIVFGRDALVEIPPFDEDIQVDNGIESRLDPEYTNLAGAVKLAMASFPEDSAKRIVVVSDGNENIGDGLEQARRAAETGIGIDVVPVNYRVAGDVSVEKIALPSDVRKGTPFDLRVVLNNTADGIPDADATAKGRLIISQKTDDQPVVLSDQPIELPPGKRVFTLREQIDQPNFYNYEARFVPDDPLRDRMAQNNRATAHTHVRGSGQVLLVEDHEHPGEHNLLVDRLRKANLEVTIRSSGQLFTSLAELQQFDTVVLANVPREHFSDDQISMLARNSHDLGSGLVMLGGPNSFGAGGWANTEVEKAMPVDFEIKNAKVIPKGALAMCMHASEIPEGNHWQKVVAQLAIKALGNEDYCGVLHWNGNEQWLWGGMIPVKSGRERMLARVDRMMPGDMPDFEPSMRMALTGFNALPDAAVKHMVVISDGDPSPPTAATINGFKNNNITVSTVAVGAHGPAESAVLKQLATQTGGKYYEVKNANALPKIYQTEARRVARPLIYEDEKGFVPRGQGVHEMLNGIGQPLPPLTGFVMTTVKANPLVEVSIRAPVLTEFPNNDVILASWTYGIGKAVAFTTDVGARWAAGWDRWDGYDKLFSQMIRWSMRPAGEQGQFTVATDFVDGKVQVVVTATDKNDEFLNFLDLGGTVIDPAMGAKHLSLKQTAPGRYVGSFDAKDAGSYFMVLNAGGDRAPVRTGINVPYSPEFRERAADDTLLVQMAELKPSGVTRPGTIIRDSSGRDDLDALLEVDTFRHDLTEARSTSDIWPLLLWVAALVFLGDVFTRRVAVSFGWVPPLVVRARDRLLRRQQAAPASAYMDRLQTRKQEVAQALSQRQASVRFEPPGEASPPTDAPLPLEGPATAAPTTSKPPSGSSLAPDQVKEQEDYTSRLLKAKKKVWEERDKKDEK